MRYRAARIAQVAVVAAAVTGASAGIAGAAGGPKAGLYVDVPRQVYVQFGADAKTVTLLGASCFAKRAGKLTIVRNGQWPVRLAVKSDTSFRFKGKTPLGTVDITARFVDGRYVGTTKVTGCETVPFKAAFHAGGG